MLPVAIIGGITCLAAACLIFCVRRQYRKTTNKLHKVHTHIHAGGLRDEKRFKEIHTALRAVNDAEFTMLMDDPNAAEEQEEAPDDDYDAYPEEEGDGVGLLKPAKDAGSRVPPPDAAPPTPAKGRRMTVTYKRAAVIPTFEELGDDDPLLKPELQPELSAAPGGRRKSILSPRGLMKKRLEKLHHDPRGSFLEGRTDDPETKQAEAHVLMAVEKLLQNHETKLRADAGLSVSENWVQLQDQFRTLKEQHEKQLTELNQSQQAARRVKMQISGAAAMKLAGARAKAGKTDAQVDLTEVDVSGD